MTPRDAAKALIRPYVLRGDPIDTLKGSFMGHAGDEVAFGLENRCVPPAEIWPRVDAALAELKRYAGGQFDPAIVDALVELVEKRELAVLALRNAPGDPR